MVLEDASLLSSFMPYEVKQMKAVEEHNCHFQHSVEHDKETSRKGSTKQKSMYMSLTAV